MKTLKNLVLAASIYALTTACGQMNPSPESKVAVTPPTPVINKCDNVKNPLEDIDWLKDMIKYVRDRKNNIKITQYTYKDKPVYFIESSEKIGNNGAKTYTVSLGNCDKSIQKSCTSEGAAGCSIEFFTDILSKSFNPIVILDEK